MPNPNPNEVDLDSVISLSRIPDTIKTIPTYNGDPKTLNSWIDGVQAVVSMYSTLTNHPVYPIWIRQIRNKIIDKANEALVTSHTPLQWPNIKATLINYFGDKRDLSTLTQKIPFMRQNTKTIDEFYQECSGLLADINSKISLDPESQGHVAPIMRIIGEQIKNAFIDGLNEPYSSYTRNYRPQTLVDAYHSAREQYAANMRKKEVTSSTTQRAVPQQQSKNVQRPYIPIPQYHPSYIPRYTGAIPRNSIPPKIPPKPFAKPVPMDVDKSQKINSAKINYINRPIRPFQQAHMPFVRNTFVPNWRPNFQSAPKFIAEELTNTELAPFEYQENIWDTQDDYYSQWEENTVDFFEYMEAQRELQSNQYVMNPQNVEAPSANSGSQTGPSKEQDVTKTAKPEGTVETDDLNFQIVSFPKYPG